MVRGGGTGSAAAGCWVTVVSRSLTYRPQNERASHGRRGDAGRGRSGREFRAASDPGRVRAWEREPRFVVGNPPLAAHFGLRFRESSGPGRRGLSVRDASRFVARDPGRNPARESAPPDKIPILCWPAAGGFAKPGREAGAIRLASVPPPPKTQRLVSARPRGPAERR